MDAVTYKTRSLIREIRSTKEYQVYQKLQKKLEENTTLFQRVNEYRKRSFLLHNSPDVGNVMNEVRSLQAEYQEELSNPIVLDYLTAEQYICKMVRTISETIAEGIELDYQFLEE